jgi:hypothetical protein
VVLGTVAGLSKQVHWVAGDIDAATGTYYVESGPTHLFAINIGAMTAAPVAVPARVTLGNDLIVQQEWIWSVDQHVIDGFSLTTGATKEFQIPLTLQEDAAGSMWSDLAGDALYFRWDATGKVYKVAGLRTDATTFSLVATVPTHQKTNDGATCNAATSVMPDSAPVLQITGNVTNAFTPGALRRVNLTFTNTYPTPVTVWPRVIKIALTDSSSSCPAAANFVIYQGLSVAVTVPGSATKSLTQLGVPTTDWPDLSMLDRSVNQDACEGTTVTIHYYVRYYG